jgi:hypothetical protein
MADVPKSRSTVDYVVDQYKLSDRWREAHEDRWENYYKLYRSYREKNDFPLKSNIFVPYTFALVEAVVPKMLGVIFNTKPIVSVSVREGGDRGMAVLLERVLDYLFDEEGLELYFRLQTFFKEAAVYGTSFAMIRPKFKDDEAMTFDYIDLEPIDLFNVYPDQRAISLSQMNHLIIRKFIDLSDLKTKAEQGIYNKSQVDRLEHYMENNLTIDQKKKDRLSSIGILEDYGLDPDKKIIEVLEFYDRDEIIVVAGRKVKLKRVPNPYGILPFIQCKYSPVPHELFGIGIPEMIETLQEELNTTRNQRMDNVNLVINRMWKASKIADIDYDNLLSYPGNVIQCGDIAGLEPLETPDVTQSAYKEEDTIKRDIELATSEYEYSRGAPPTQRETATGIIRLQQAANARFDSVVKGIEFGTVRRMAKVFVWMTYLFMPPQRFAQIVGLEEFVRLKGKSFYQQNPNEILRCYNFQPMGSSTTAVKELRAQQIMQAFEMFNGDPYIEQVELRRMVLNSLDMKNVPKLLKLQPDQPPPEQAGAPPGGPPPPGGMMAGDMMAAGATTGGGPMGSPGGPMPAEGGMM